MNAVNAFCKHFEQFYNSPLSNLRKFYTEDVEFIDPLNHLHGLPVVTAYFSKLHKNVRTCVFEIQSVSHSSSGNIESCFVCWKMKMTSTSTRQIELEGLSHLKIKSEGIYFQRDYYDVGELVYENVPFLNWIIKFIKKRLEE